MNEKQLKTLDETKRVSALSREKESREAKIRALERTVYFYVL